MIAATQSNHPLASVTAAGNPPSPVEQACARLRSAQMRVTKPRISILEALFKRSGPVRIEQLHQDLDQHSCDLVTVYRCLAAFEDVGLVRRSFTHNGTSLWEIGLNRPRQYHIVCKVCGKAENVDYFPVDEMERLLHERGYQDVSHVIEFFGVCPQCQSAPQANPTQAALTATGKS